jgi:hypothetical protein
VPINTARPTITANKSSVDDQLTAQAGTWSSSTTPSFAYQWQRCGYQAAILGDRPAAYWPLDEAAGPKAEELTGNNNNGTYQGTPLFGVPGALADGAGTAIRGGSVSVPDSGSLHMGSGFTLEAWVKMGTSNSGGAIFHQGTDGFALSVWPWEIRLWEPHFVEGDPVVNPTIADSTTGVPADGQWHHVVAQDAGNVGHIYLDGTELPATYYDNGVGTPTKPLIISPQGDIDEPAVYPYVLSRTQVQAHYAAGLQPCTDIATATTPSYQLTTSDIGKSVRVKVTATNGAGSAAAASTGTNPVVQKGGLALDSPHDGATVRTTTPPLAMVPVSGTDPTDYEFELAQDDHFTAGVQNSGWRPSSPTYTVPTTWKLKDGNTYYWHARTRSSTGVVSPWVGPRSFKVALNLFGIRDYWPMWKRGNLALQLS